ncbi:MAG: trypsin-like peptidase domain-containing protein [Chloroflexi bacterium]|nr:trypsin-like peptidase domain-containing protein [Chloroflexota bacterium]
MPQPLSTRNPLNRYPFQLLINDQVGMISSGTGFFYSLDDKLFLVTNWHNVSGKNPFTGAPLHGSGRLPLTLTGKLATVMEDGESFAFVGRTLELYKDYSPIWLEHPELGSGCDVVAIPLDSAEKIPPGMHKPVNTYSDTKVPVSPGGVAFVVGFPKGISVGPGLPLMKSGYIASEPDYDAAIGGEVGNVGGLKGGLRIPAFFLDIQTRPGMSGSPVFASYTGLWDPEDPYGTARPEGEMRLTGSTRIGTGFEFVGCYSGRVQEKENEAILGLCWREDTIKSICEGGRQGAHPHVR